MSAGFRDPRGHWSAARGGPFTGGAGENVEVPIEHDRLCPAFEKTLTAPAAEIAAKPFVRLQSTKPRRQLLVPRIQEAGVADDLRKRTDAARDDRRALTH